jgi:glycine oxidase
VIVAGAGIIGLSCAWRLAQQGLRITLFDAGQAGQEASWAGAGLLAPGGEIDCASPLADLALRSLGQFGGFVRELEEETKCEIDFRTSGAMEVAMTDAEAEALKLRAAKQAGIGIRSEECQYNGLAARFYPDDALVNPRDVTHALSIACRRRGVEIREWEPVQQIAASGRTIRTNRGDFNDDGVIIAAGAWSSDLLPGLPRTFPVRGHLIGYRMTPGLLDPILRHGNTYLLQRKSGVLVAGTSSERVGFDRNVDAGAAAAIHERAAGLLPCLRSEHPVEQWIGFRPGIDADMPAIGRLPGTAIWTAFGHYRNGILLAPETARLIAASVTSQ